MNKISLILLFLLLFSSSSYAFEFIPVIQGAYTAYSTCQRITLNHCFDVVTSLPKAIQGFEFKLKNNKIQAENCSESPTITLQVHNSYRLSGVDILVEGTKIGFVDNKFGIETIGGVDKDLYFSLAPAQPGNADERSEKVYLGVEAIAAEWPDQGKKNAGILELTVERFSSDKEKEIRQQIKDINSQIETLRKKYSYFAEKDGSFILELITLKTMNENLNDTKKHFFSCNFDQAQKTLIDLQKEVDAIETKWDSLSILDKIPYYFDTNPLVVALALAGIVLLAVLGLWLWSKIFGENREIGHV